METSRILSLVVQYGFGAVLGLVGLWCGVRSGYMRFDLREDRRLLNTIVAGFVLLLAFSIVFTLILPHWPAETAP